MADEEAKGRLVLGIKVVVPDGDRPQGWDTYKALHHSYVTKDVTVAELTCTQAEAKSIADTFKSKNSDAWARWTGRVVL